MKTKLDIIIPVYNEADSIEQLIKQWAKLLQNSFDYNFIICEDGSTDGTKKILLRLKSSFPITLNQRTYRRGYGQAVIDGIRSTKANFVLSVDSDNQYDPNDFFKLWQLKDQADVVCGKRLKRAEGFNRKLYHQVFLIFFKLLFLKSIFDPSSPFVLFKRSKVLPHIKYLSYLKEGFWWGFIGMCLKKKLTIKEVGITHRLRTKGQTHTYHLKKIPMIALTNSLGLIKLRLTK